MIKVKKVFSVFILIIIVFALAICIFIKEKSVDPCNFFNFITKIEALGFSKEKFISDDDIKNNLDLVLVNSENLVMEDPDIELIKLSNGEKVHKNIYPQLQKMFDDARSLGIYPYVLSGYRSHERQKELYDNKIDALIKEGYSSSDARKETNKWIAKPGSSEHQLGIAIDVKGESGKSTNGDVYHWLSKNAHKYGFIVRYPNDKIDITGISYEPWHFRYVGIEHAEKIYNEGLTLEEYLKK